MHICIHAAFLRVRVIPRTYLVSLVLVLVSVNVFQKYNTYYPSSLFTTTNNTQGFSFRFEHANRDITVKSMNELVGLFCTNIDDCGGTRRQK